jgi:HSP20 family molecular chaperone IbpA
MTRQEMSKHQHITPAKREETRSPGRVLVPAVDIFESVESLTLIADLPGVDKDRLEISTAKEALTIHGTVALKNRGRSLLREFSVTNYYRQFKLSDKFDAEKCYAELRDGVLVLRVPKTEAAIAKRIAIRH